MNTQFNTTETFQQRVAQTTIRGINKCVNELFEQYSLLQNWVEKKNELDYQYRDSITTNALKRNGQLFLVFILLPVLGIIDYASVAPFINYLSVSAGGGLIGVFLSCIGFLFFIFIELATGWVLIYYSKKRSLSKGVIILLALGLAILPSYLIYTTNDIDTNKTTITGHKTMALAIVSIIVHIVFFLVIKDVWAGIHYCIYYCKNKALESKHPHKAMKALLEKLQDYYLDFDKYTATYTPEQQVRLINNKAWYIKHKISTGTHIKEFDLSDYDPNTFYTIQNIGYRQNGMYQFTVKQ
jgi:hypothetical protein